MSVIRFPLERTRSPRRNRDRITEARKALLQQVGVIMWDEIPDYETVAEKPTDHNTESEHPQ